MRLMVLWRHYYCHNSLQNTLSFHRCYASIAILFAIKNIKKDKKYYIKSIIILNIYFLHLNTVRTKESSVTDNNYALNIFISFVRVLWSTWHTYLHTHTYTVIHIYLWRRHKCLQWLLKQFCFDGNRVVQWLQFK